MSIDCQIGFKDGPSDSGGELDFEADEEQ